MTDKIELTCKVCGATGFYDNGPKAVPNTSHSYIYARCNTCAELFCERVEDKVFHAFDPSKDRLE